MAIFTVVAIIQILYIPINIKESLMLIMMGFMNIFLPIKKVVVGLQVLLIIQQEILITQILVLELSLIHI